MPPPASATSRALRYLAEHPARVLGIWLALRTILWTAAMAHGQPNAQIDMIEWGSWGGVFQWGYPKHPPFAAWVAGLFLRLSPGDVWGLYLAGYLCSAGCVWLAWKLANEFLPPHRAVFAALALDGLAYLTNDAADYSNNIVLNLGWAASTWFAYRAFTTADWRNWLAFGISVGFAILTKYTIGLLLVPLGIYLLAHPSFRRNFRTVGPYLAVLVALGMMAPHIVWMIENRFITLRYISERTEVTTDLGSRLLNPLVFLSGQLGYLLPVVLILFPLLRKKRNRVTNGGFLHAAVLGPLMGFLLIALATGGAPRIMWASPLWTFSGVWLMAFHGGQVNPRTTLRTLGIWVFVTLGILGLALGFQWVEPQLTNKAGRTLFPGKALIREVDRLWYARYDRPYAIAAGDAWRAGNLACYAEPRPMLYSNRSMGYFMFDSKITPWTNDADFLARGGVMVWDADMDHEGTMNQVRGRFPTAEILPVIELPFQTSVPVKPVRTGIAFLAPPQK